MRRLPRTDEAKHAAGIVVLAPRSLRRQGLCFKAALVDSERYVLACYHYIELNPVRAGKVRQVSDYRWSSYHANALGRTETRLRPHPTYLSLGTHPDERRAAYRDLVDAGLPPHDAEALTLHTHQQKPWGSERFKRQLEALTQRAIEVRPRGRPRRSA